MKNPHAPEPLEARIAPATLLALSGTNELLTFDSATPGTITKTLPITGLPVGETLHGMDFRPATGELYALGAATLYAIDYLTGQAVVIATLAADPTDATSPFAGLSGTDFGVDFNPVPDRLRVVSDAEQNLRINPGNGLVTTDLNLNPGTPDIVAAAYTNAFAGATSTTLFVLDSASDTLFAQNPPNNGTLVTVGALGVDFSTAAGFDIQTIGGANTAFAALEVGGVTGLYTINLSTGAATLAGSIGTGAALRDIAIAPTLITLVNPKTATFTDVDGDLVTVKTTRGAFGALDFKLAVQPNGNMRFAELRLSDDGTEFDGANITITAKRTAAGGDGFVGVGYINALAHDLGIVTVGGDLGRIDAGDTTFTTPGLKSLTVQSLGRLGAANAGGSIISNIAGPLGALTVKTDIFEASVNVTGGTGILLGKLTIGGSLIGGSLADSGRIQVNGGDIGPVKIARDLRGGGGAFSAFIGATNIGPITIGGSIIGSGPDSAGISTSGDMGAVKIARNVQGGAGANSGIVFSDGKIKAVTIGGSLIGGDADGAGFVFGNSGIGAVTIGGSMLGALGEESGSVEANGPIASVKVGGDVRGGDGDESGYIHSLGFLGPVAIKGSLVGGVGAFSALVYAGSAVAIGNVMKGVTVGGSVIGGSGNGSGSIGSANGGAGSSFNVDIGPIVIKGSLIGNGLNSAAITGDEIASITIGGDILGGASSNSGYINATSFLKKLTVTGSVIGGGGSGSGFIGVQKLGPAKIGRELRGGNGDFSGHLSANLGGAGAITIGGGVTSGIGNRSGSVEINGLLGSLAIGGDILGTASDPVFITARGTDGKTTPPALGKLTVKGSATYAVVHAGALLGNVNNADASIGAITIGGDFISSSIAAGVNAGADTFFGTTDDATGAFGHTTGNLSRIASVIIKGQALGTSGGADTFGIVAQSIGVLKIGAATYAPLNATTQGPISLAITGDFFARTDV